MQFVVTITYLTEYMVLNSNFKVDLCACVQMNKIALQMKP